MSKEYLIENAKGRMNLKLLNLDLPMLEKSSIKAIESSIKRAPFPDEKSMPLKMLINIPRMFRAMTTFSKSVKLIKRSVVKADSARIDNKTHKQIVSLLKKQGMDNIGHVKITSKDVFKNLAVPYENAILFTARQGIKPILSSPSVESQVEVGRIYGKTGLAANKLTQFLEKRGYGAMPSHSLGGAVDYTKLGVRAGFGYFGRHGLLIEPISGSNHRLGAVFTNISNLEQYFETDDDHKWISDFCKKCGKCIRECPASAIYENPMVDEFGYTTCIDYQKCGIVFGSQYGCNVCVAVCPFTTVRYEKIRKREQKG